MSSISNSNSNNSNISSSYDPNIDYRIISTAEDAILAKQATAQAKYYRDPFCNAFCEKTTVHTHQQPHHRTRRYFQPIIKRGTHARVCCMDRALTAFLKAHATVPAPPTTTTKTVQIVVLGAGKDTSYWRLVTKSLMGMEEYLLANPYPRKASSSSASASKSASSSLPVLPKVIWKEVDHSSVVHEKAAIIQGSTMLSQCCPNLRPTNTIGYSSVEGNYHLIAADLRDSSTSTILHDKLQLDPNIPTLFLVECVFMYLPTESATRSLLREIASTHPQAWVAMYEPILQADAFGQMMQQNLLNAQVATPGCGLLQTRTVKEQLQLFIAAGFARAVGCDMGIAYQTIVTPQQRQMANQAELLDEMEEWSLIMKHYCFVMATTCRTQAIDPLTQVGDGTSTTTTTSTVSPLGFITGKCEILTQPDEE
jgi:tRNA wybutosine-synthesizing protein 4